MKRGFTLIEMLITIVLIGVVLTLTTISIIKIKNNMTENLYDDKIEYIEAGAKEWGIDNLNSLNSLTCKCISVDTLVTSGYITGDDENKSAITDPLEGGSFNDKYVCLKYITTSGVYNSENVYNTEVTSEYSGSTCSES